MKELGKRGRCETNWGERVRTVSTHDDGVVVLPVRHNTSVESVRALPYPFGFGHYGTVTFVFEAAADGIMHPTAITGWRAWEANSTLTSMTHEDFAALTFPLRRSP